MRVCIWLVVLVSALHIEILNVILCPKSLMSFFAVRMMTMYIVQNVQSLIVLFVFLTSNGSGYFKKIFSRSLKPWKL